MGAFPVEKDIVACLGLGAAICNEVTHSSNGITLNQAHSDKSSRKDAKSMAFSVGIANTISTSGGVGLTGSGGDVFFSPSVAVLFLETAKVYVPANVCEGRRIDYETWRLIGTDETDTTTAEDRLTASQSGKKVSDVSLTDDIGAVTHSKSAMYNKVATDMRAAVSDSLSTMFEATNAWNTHSLHSQYDIVKVRMPALQERQVSHSLEAPCSGPAQSRIVADPRPAMVDLRVARCASSCLLDVRCSFRTLLTLPPCWLLARLSCRLVLRP